MFKHSLPIKKSTPDTQYPVDYFAVNIKILKTAALWVPEDYPKWKYRSYITFSLFSFVFCVVFCTPSEFISLLDTQSNLNAFVMNLGIALTHGIANLKVINWYARRKEILSLMNILQNRNYQYESCPGFEPGRIMQKAKQINVTFSKMFFWCGIMVPVSGYISGFYNLWFNKESLYTNGEFQCTCLPFYSWLPFNHSTEKTCVLAMIFQSFPMIYLTLMIVALDTLYMGLINYITAHLLVLQGAFTTVKKRALLHLQRNKNFLKLELYDDEELEEEMMTKMRKCIKHLQTIQKLCDFMEDIYSLQTLGQVLVSLFVICTCLFLISTEPVTSKTFLVEVVYVLAIEFQLTLYCWFGNELTLASMGIPNAIYESDWISFSQRLKRCILITCIRMKRPFFMTVGKFTPLTLETLQMILRGSYSLYAVLKNRNAT